MYRIIPCTIGTPETDEGELASFTMTAQIRLLVCKELRSMETQVFSALDNLVYDQVNIGRENPLAVWSCLCTLLFIYKDHMTYTRSTLPEYDISPMIRKFHKEVLHLGSLRFTDSESRCLKFSAKSASVQYLDVGICSQRCTTAHRLLRWTGEPKRYLLSSIAILNSSGYSAT